MLVRVVERGVKGRDDDATRVIFTRLTGVYWPAGDEDCRGCRELLGGGVTKTGRANRDTHPGRGRGPLTRMKRARMVIVAVVGGRSTSAIEPVSQQ